MSSRAPPRLRPKTIFSSCYPPIFPWVTTESFLADRPGGVSAKFGAGASPARFVRTFLRIAELTVIEREGKDWPKSAAAARSRKYRTALTNKTFARIEMPYQG